MRLNQQLQNSDTVREKRLKLLGWTVKNGVYRNPRPPHHCYDKLGAFAVEALRNRRWAQQ